MPRKTYGKRLITAILAAAFALALVLSAPAQALAPASSAAAPSASDDSYVAVSAGSGHTMAIKADGSLWAWGWNWNGQLGDGTQTVFNYDSRDDAADNDKNAPEKIMDGIASVSAGATHTLAIKTDGSLWAWGEGYSGDGTDIERLAPTRIMGGVASASAGTLYSMAIKTDGSLWAWGNNLYGQLGDGTTVNRPAPVKIMDGVASVSAGDSHTLAVKTDGSLWAWGSNFWGELGDGGRSVYDNATAEWVQDNGSLTPVKIMDGVASASAGLGYSLAVKTDGSLWAWGSNCNCQLGDGTTADRLAPVKIMDGAASVSAGATHAVAVKTDGSLWTWGRNDYGQLGNGEQSIYDIYTLDIVDDRNQAVPVKILDGAASAAAGGAHTAAIKPDGSLWLWGSNNRGQLASAFSANRLTPAKLRGKIIIPDEATAVSALYALGLFRGVGLSADGTPDFALDRAPTRNEAIIMLVRLLGKENDALGGTWATPFTDVPVWAAPYVGYAYENGLTGGVGPASFGGAATVTASQYITFVLRALGYNEKTGDFAWSNAWTLSDKLGFTDGKYSATSQDITRGDVAVISYAALSAVNKVSGDTLLESLINSGAISPEQAGVLGLDNTSRNVSIINISRTSAPAAADPTAAAPLPGYDSGSNMELDSDELNSGSTGDGSGGTAGMGCGGLSTTTENNNMLGGFGVRLPLTISGGGAKLNFSVTTSADETTLPTDSDGNTYGQNFLYGGFSANTPFNKDAYCDLGLAYSPLTGTDQYSWKPYFLLAVNGIKYSNTKETDGAGGVPLLWYRNGYKLGETVDVEIRIDACPSDPTKSRVLLRTEGLAYHTSHYGSGGEARVVQLTYADVPKINTPRVWKVIASCAFNEPEDIISSAYVSGVFKDIKVGGAAPVFGATDRKYGYDASDYNGVAGDYLLQVCKGD